MGISFEACEFRPPYKRGRLVSLGASQSRSSEGTGLVLRTSGRHDYGTRVLRGTGNLAAVMKTMGHKGVRTAMQYQHPELDIVREALNNQSPIAVH